MPNFFEKPSVVPLPQGRTETPESSKKRSLWDYVEHKRNERRQRLETIRKEDLKRERQHTEEVALSTDHNLKEYQIDLQFDPEDFRGKAILDLGSGEYETFSREMTQNYDALVVSLNPKLKDQEAREAAQKKFDWQEMSVAARGQQLPLKKESFDVILARWSISHYLQGEDREDELILAIEQAYETLKPGGIILMNPIQSITPAIMNKLKNKGINVFPHGQYRENGNNSIEINKPLNGT